MKHQEHIAAFEVEKLQEILPLEEGFNKATSSMVTTFLKDTLPALVFNQRLALDDTDKDKKRTHKQLLPYILITKDEGEVTKVLVYQRGKGVGESRLAGKMSIGLGGHIDITDAISALGVISLPATIRENIFRELQEELKFSTGDVDCSYGFELNDMLDSSVFLGFINDNSDHVGKDHLGIVMSVPCIDVEASIREAELQEIGWYTLEELKDNPYFNFENWSKILIDSLAYA